MSFSKIIHDVWGSFGNISKRSFEERLLDHDWGKLQVSGLGINDDETSVTQNRPWDKLPAELLRNVIRRVEASESTWPGRKDIVACAGVCRSWREMCIMVVQSTEFSGKITFPFSLKQPGLPDGTVQCFIKRDKSKQTYHLYLNLSPVLLVEDGKFLLSAKRVRGAFSTEYVIYMDADNIPRSSSTCIGKVRSNFLGSKFTIFDTQPSYDNAQFSHPGRSQRFNSRKISPKVPTESYNAGHVKHETLLFGARAPHRMQCIMHSVPLSSLEPGGSVSDQPEVAVSRGYDENKPLVLWNIPPRWHVPLQSWTLNFKGRVTLPSVKNIQLIKSTDFAAVPSGPGPSQPAEYDDDKIILQFGKVSKDMFTMDYRYPLSTFQAFAISLTMFKL